MDSLDTGLDVKLRKAGGGAGHRPCLWQTLELGSVDKQIV